MYTITEYFTFLFTEDVLDEYLGSEKGKPTEPTIEEQPEPVTEDE